MRGAQSDLPECSLLPSNCASLNELGHSCSELAFHGRAAPVATRRPVLGEVAFGSLLSRCCLEFLNEFAFELDTAAKSNGTVEPVCAKIHGPAHLGHSSLPRSRILVGPRGVRVQQVSK